MYEHLCKLIGKCFDHCTFLVPEIIQKTRKQGLKKGWRLPDPIELMFYAREKLGRQTVLSYLMASVHFCLLLGI